MVQEPDQVIAAKYRLVRRLARGGMGSVWLARHLELDTEVALKFLRAEQTHDEKAEARFRREARAAAALKSPHVVQVHDFGIDEGSPYIAMELLRGEDLRTLLDREGRLPLSYAKQILGQAARGLRAAHQCGTIHRDIKPSNLFLEEFGGDVHVKLLDFGIAKGPDLDSSELTTQGQVFGSPAYMSPEQARGRQVDARSDIWSLGAVFFEMVTGALPFVGTTASDLVVKLCTEDPELPSHLHPDLPHDVDVFVRRALHRDANRRFQNADEMLGMLELIPEDEENERSFAFVRRSPGRSEETMPLSAASVAPESSASQGHELPYDSRSLRQSLVPARPPKSSARGVFAVGGVLALLGLVGLTMRRELPTDRLGEKTEPGEDVSSAEPQRSAEPEVAVLPKDIGAGREKEARAPVSEPGPVTAATGSPNSAEAPKPKPKLKAPSRSQSSKVEPKADPVFGLPVESP